MRVDELRHALQEKAEMVGSGQVHERVASVRLRVAGARRRRAARVGGVAVAALAAVGLVVAPPLRGHRPAPTDHNAPSRLAGRTVPTTQTATGYTYDYAGGVESRPGRKRLTLTLPDSDRPRLVMWASSDTGSRPTVRLRDLYGTRETSAPGGFDRYLYVDPGQDSVVLTQSDAGADTRLALATYVLSKTPPPGVSNGRVTYRAHVLGDDLIGARIGARGDSDVSLRFTLPQQPVWFSDVCYGTRSSYQVTVDGRLLLGADCGGNDAPYDVASASAVSTRRMGRPGDSVVVRVRLVTDQRHPGPATDARVVLGVGVYADRSPTVSVAGARVSAGLELGGHEYLAGEWFTTDPGGRELTVHVSRSEKPRLVTFVSHGLATAGAKISLSADGQPVVSDQWGPQGTEQNGEDYVVQPGDTPTLVLRVDRGLRPGARVAVVFSDLVH